MNRTDRAMQQLCKDVIVLDSDEDEAPNLSDMARRASEILGWLAPKRKAVKPMKRERVAKEKVEQETKRQRRAEVRAAVVARAGGRCERILGDPGSAASRERCGHPGVEMDHFWGRAREESVESCWLHCVLCARAKTENRPSRAYWLWNFGSHTGRLFMATGNEKYREQVAKVDRALALEEAQHPGSGAEGDGK